jgi:asparagine synthase (glutamine-hydrolysing)
VDIIRDFDQMIWHLDEPQADAAPLNIYNISAKAREKGIVVLLGGTGGDDLFSGYRRHQSLYFHQLFQKIPAFIGQLLALGSNNIPSGSPNWRRLRKFLAHLRFNDQSEQLANLYAWLPFADNLLLFNAQNRELLKDYNPHLHLMHSLENIPKEASLLNKMLYWELKYFLPDHNLNYTDKMSMAHGVEVRVPYLDKELVEFSTSIPPELKMKGTTTKYLLRKVAERYLPKEVIYRSKTGFGAPVRDWICGPLDKRVQQAFSAELCAKRQLFDSANVLNLVERNKLNKIDASYPIWGLLAIASWWEQFVDN